MHGGNQPHTIKQKITPYLLIRWLLLCLFRFRVFIPGTRFAYKIVLVILRLTAFQYGIYDAIPVRRHIVANPRRTEKLSFNIAVVIGPTVVFKVKSYFHTACCFRLSALAIAATKIGRSLFRRRWFEALVSLSITENEKSTPIGADLITLFPMLFEFTRFRTRNKSIKPYKFPQRYYIFGNPILFPQIPHLPQPFVLREGLSAPPQI